MLRNQKDAFYFDDYVVAIMVGMGLFILPFLGEFAISTFWLETLWLIIMSRNFRVETLIKPSVGTIHFVIRKCSKLEKEPNFYVTVQIIESDDDVDSVWSSNRTIEPVRPAVTNVVDGVYPTKIHSDEETTTLEPYKWNILIWFIQYIFLQHTKGPIYFTAINHMIKNFKNLLRFNTLKYLCMLVIVYRKWSTNKWLNCMV